ncbi:MAG: hypothetical protein IJ415_01470 [Clostridia bacterium]|nr:hypothetical protein [Clostridia bacterium]
MNLLKKIVNRIVITQEEREKQEQTEALNYLYDRLKIRSRRNMSMQDYFDKHYRQNCYYYSTFILMCMKPTDRLVRGEIHLGGEHDFISKTFNDGKIVPNYKHGWVEFEFNGKWWVYDDHYSYPIPIDRWYEMKTPYEIYKKFTQSELIDYVKANFPDKVIETKNGETTFISTDVVCIKKYNIPFYWIDLEIQNGEVVKFDQDKDKKECLC